jgi:GMP synthase (glutamine-hydrolysing)
MNKIAVIDFGGQYTHLIARRIRQLNVYSEIHQPEDFQFENNIVGIILSGGPQSIHSEDAYKIEYDFTKTTVPVLGICYGHQLLAAMLGGKVESGNNTEYGSTIVQLESNSILFKNMAKEQKVWMSHGDYVAAIPETFHIIASSEDIGIAAYQSNDNKLFGLQFHPEVTHSENGMKMLENFVLLCTNERNWDSKRYKQKLINAIREQAKDKKLIVLLSGGVDSLVALELCIHAVGGENIYSFHIDTGFMRKNESQDLAEHFKKLGYKNLKIIEAEDMFLKALHDVVEPEKKRFIIGKLFVDIVQEQLKPISTATNDWLLVQGTIYPDTIESGANKKSAKIKTHHNRVEEIEKLIRQGNVLEPLKELYKDEVRELGTELGLPYELVQRQPFPGPGLAIRVICREREGESILAKTWQQFSEMQEKFGFRGTILPVKSVGVQGDFRSYHHPAVIWLENKESNWQEIRTFAKMVVNRISDINRVVFSHCAFINFTCRNLFLEKENLNELRELDAFFREQTNEMKQIWQMPVVQLPIFFNNKRCYVVRPVCSTDAMTADVYEMDFQKMETLILQAKKQFPIGEVFYDITTKPPGTIEWE